MTADLIPWLRECLDTEEKRAYTVKRMLDEHCHGGYHDVGGMCAEEYEFIAAHDPTRVLRQVAAHRAILAVHGIVWRDIGWLDEEREEEREEQYAEIPVCGSCVPKHSHFNRREDAPEGPCATVRHLASIYSDRPGYRKEWTP